MNSPLKIGVTGCSGRMGQTVIECISQKSNFALAGALERTGHQWIDKPLNTVANVLLNQIVTDDLDNVFKAVDVVIDFTTPVATLDFALKAKQHQTPLVIGTTGFTNNQLKELQKISKSVPVLQAGNMSIGVNLLAMLTQQVAQTLDKDHFDIEIIEAHHNKKVDAPSGTALMLGDAAANGRKVKLEDVTASCRDGITEARKEGDIGFSIVRGGDIVGEHDVMFAGTGERLILRHVATDRKIFGRGALQAAQWLHNKPVGFYNMRDVLSL